MQVLKSVTLQHLQKEGRLLARQNLLAQFCIAHLQSHIRRSDHCNAVVGMRDCCCLVWLLYLPWQMRTLSLLRGSRHKPGRASYASMAPAEASPALLVKLLLLVAKEESSKATGGLLSEQDRKQAYHDSKVQATNDSILLIIKTGFHQAEPYTNGLTSQ